MELETDADRLASLEALGGSFVQINGQPVFGLYDPESFDTGFEDSLIRAPRHVLLVLTSDVRRYQIKQGAQVEISDEGSFVISQPPTNEVGQTILILDRP